jgi:hypothetical protein
VINNWILEYTESLAKGPVLRSVPFKINCGGKWNYLFNISDYSVVYAGQQRKEKRTGKYMPTENVTE